VLSVAGFFALLIGFLPGLWFILAGKRASFLGRKAGTVDVRTKTVIVASNSAVMTMSRLEGTPMVGGREAYIPQGGRVEAYQGGYPRVFLYLAQQ